jgi:hypothetical protein
MYLLVIDYFSRYIEIAKLFNTSSQSVINHLKSIFARHGIPECFMSDGGPQHVSFVLKQFAQSYMCMMPFIFMMVCGFGHKNESITLISFFIVCFYY